MNSANFYKWVDQSNVAKKVTDKQCVRQPIEVSTPTLQSCIDELNQRDRRVTVHSISCNKQLHETCARCVLRQFTENHKTTRLRMCREFKHDLIHEFLKKTDL